MFRYEKDKSCLLPIDLFQIEVDIPFFADRPKKFSSYQLPDFSDLFYNEPFAQVGLYYNHEGIGGRLEVQLPFTHAEYPDFMKGDALELFLATKNMTQASTLSRFCHHFVLLPAQVGGFYAKEITHFRPDDTRPIYDPLLIEITPEFDKKSYSLDFFIPKESLFSFEDRGASCSFSYIVHASKKTQSFSCSYDNFNIAQMPSLWAVGQFLNP